MDKSTLGRLLNSSAIYIHLHQLTNKPTTIMSYRKKEMGSLSNYNHYRNSIIPVGEWVFYRMTLRLYSNGDKTWKSAYRMVHNGVVEEITDIEIEKGADKSGEEICEFYQESYGDYQILGIRFLKEGSFIIRPRSKYRPGVPMRVNIV